MNRPFVSIVMGSDSDLAVMRKAAEVLDELGVAWELDIVSAHRTPERLFAFAAEAHLRGVAVVIAGAGGAAHLPGMVAAISPLPVIGVPIRSSNSIDGWDSVLSILQMPAGVPVATVAVDGARNAGILAAQIVSVADARVREALLELKAVMRDAVLDKSRQVACRSGRTDPDG
jgi:5-(carboxyamino)imidazole ribonucleotide mutase